MIKIQESFQANVSKMSNEIKNLKENTNIHEMNLGTAAKQLKEQKAELDKFSTTLDSYKSLKDNLSKMASKEELNTFIKNIEDEVTESYNILTVSYKCIDVAHYYPI